MLDAKFDLEPYLDLQRCKSLSYCQLSSSFGLSIVSVYNPSWWKKEKTYFPGREGIGYSAILARRREKEQL